MTRRGNSRNEKQAPGGPLSEQDAIRIMSGLASAFYVLDENSDFIYMNEKAARLLGQEGKDLEGRNAWTEFPDAVPAGLKEMYDRIRETGIAETKEIYYRPAGLWLQVDAQEIGEGRIAVLFHDISRYKEAETRLELLAYRDNLTGLPNRSSAIQRITESIGKGKPFSVVLFDIDSFRQLNDLHGHQAGDRYIRGIAERLKGILEDGEVVTRIGADEFIFLTRRTDPDELKQWVQELFRQTAISVRLYDHVSFSASASVGISRYPEDATTTAELLSMADHAMHESKTKRGNCFQLFHDQMRKRLDRRRVIEDDLFSGNFKENGFACVVQPQLDGESGRLLGIETLSRWDHPELGVLPPSEFIPIAEETGKIKELTIHLLNLVLEKGQRWDMQYGRVPRMAVNVTSSLLNDKQFFSTIMKMLGKWEIPPDRFEIEITEWKETLSSNLVLSNLRKCRSQGISVAIDDFGTGFSGLSYLTNFPVDKIKIDRFFVSGIGRVGKSEAILKSVVSLAEGLGCELIAEGVETGEQRRFLLGIGCRGIQGYYFDAPLPPGEFEEKYLRS
ncbi:PAS domain S-box-containing protein/diguanylate cyclase (GGDEF) domain-containing protein [Bhargavaea beijingensis]|uniref:PAS domain S-box-containing protein/diguanylate cyclase (GGDEF) domain-containing protein n=1 Tax=Bhargavaea beijingensis TaxID=426756 RepID=A0A1G7GWQ5_9BACL|nr:EAL domain-containing protein [Bhargavaea beijingensis]SDE92535.1 PAS domain S-box-containing protein/diguanylate cyclase (GGDEF) domain-containing protein [Bhargavaea beijingensis]